MSPSVFDLSARFPGRRGRHEGARLAVERTVVTRREVAELHDHRACRGIHIDVLSLQADRGVGVASTHRPPLQTIAAALRVYRTARPRRLPHPILGDDSAAVGDATIEHHLPEACKVAQSGVEAGAAEFTPRARRTVHYIEAV